MNWEHFFAFAAALLATVGGIAIDRWWKKRPRVISYLGHSAQFPVQPPSPPGAPAVWVGTHSIVVRNVGKETANNVRVGHSHLTTYTVTPNTQYAIEQLQGGGGEIVFPKLRPGEQLTIAYLYIPASSPVNLLHVKSDEGFATIVPALPQPQPPKWMMGTLHVLVFLGAVTALYILGEVVLVLWGLAQKAA